MNSDSPAELDASPLEFSAREPEVAKPVAAAAPASKRSPSRLHKRILAGAALLGAAALAGAVYLHFFAPFESTDDAAVESDITAVAPQVAGRVLRLYVQDNQEVRRGQILFEIDPSDFEARFAAAQANLQGATGRLGQARAQLIVDQARIDQTKADIAAAAANEARAAADLGRYRAVGTSAVSQSQIDRAATQRADAAAQTVAARDQLAAAEARVALDRAGIRTASAGVAQARAARAQAALDLSHTRVLAEVAGRVARRAVEQGDYFQAGQTALAIVQPDVWVVANFKETQLTDLRVGQRARIHVDAFPGRELIGRIQSLQDGTGSRFSLFPPENAAGNFIKVVQRVPVKIVFGRAELARAGLPIGPGMSVEAEVRVR